MSAWAILLPAFAMMTLIAASHVYFGLHVLARGIIFIDLALAQVVALGASLAFLFGFDGHGPAAQAFGLVAGLLAACGFAPLRRLSDKTVREAVIGCVYAFFTVFPATAPWRASRRRASPGTSSGRSRSAGISIGKTARR